MFCRVKYFTDRALGFGLGKVYLSASTKILTDIIHQPFVSTCKCCVPEKTVSDGDGTQSI